MQPLACQRCGASLPIPDDLVAVSARCQFCGDQTPLPQYLLAARQQQRDLQYDAQIRTTAQQQQAAMRDQTVKTVSRTMLLVIFLVVGVPILLMIGIGVFIFFIARTTAEATSTPVSVTVDPIAAPAPPPPDDAKSTGEERMTALMKSADAAGCKDVIFPPTREQGDQTYDTKFVVDGTCVRVFVATGMPNNKVTLSMKTPFGEAIKTPDPGTELDFIYCPKKEGPHPMATMPATEAYYTVAAIGCPASVANKKKK